VCVRVWVRRFFLFCYDRPRRFVRIAKYRKIKVQNDDDDDDDECTISRPVASYIRYVYDIRV